MQTPVRAAGPGITVSGVSRPLFVHGENMTERGSAQRVVQRQNSAAGIAKYRIHPLFMQTFNNGSCSGYAQGVHLIFS